MNRTQINYFTDRIAAARHIREAELSAMFPSKPEPDMRELLSMIIAGKAHVDEKLLLGANCPSRYLDVIDAFEFPILDEINDHNARQHDGFEKSKKQLERFAQFMMDKLVLDKVEADDAVERVLTYVPEVLKAAAGSGAAAK